MFNVLVIFDIFDFYEIMLLILYMLIKYGFFYYMKWYLLKYGVIVVFFF